MRTFVGCLVLIAGVAGLGYIGTTQHAVRMQSAIHTDANTVVQTAAQLASHNVQTFVSGRDLRVVGRVTTPTDLANLQASFGGIDGVRVLDLSGVQTLPLADPYHMTFTITAQGDKTLTCVAPNAPTRSFLGQAPAGNADVDISLAAGVPDGDWITVAIASIEIAETMSSVDMTLIGQTLTVQGHVASSAERSIVLDALAALPSAYTVETQIDIEDDGTPLRLTLALRDGGVSGGGKVPPSLELAEISGRFAINEPLSLTQATIPAFDPDWPDAARIGMDALAALRGGQLQIEGRAVSLMGAASPDGRAQAEGLLATLPANFTFSSDIELWDDGAPLTMTLIWDGVTATASGKFPDGFTPRSPDGGVVDSTATLSFLPDEVGTFTRHADVGVAALGLLNTGQVIVSETSIALSGTADSPQVDRVLDSVLATVQASAQISRDITYLDDGSPAAWTLTYTPEAGASLAGRLPTTLTAHDMTDALGVPVSDLAASALTDTSTDDTLDILGSVATHLPELETLTFARDRTGSTLDLVVSPGVDSDLVAVDLAERLPQNIVFSLAPLEDLPAEGTLRRNTATGLTERFEVGFWLPIFEFSADVAGCTQQVAAVFDRSRITFFSGSARLDAPSIRAINGVASLAKVCLGSGLMLDIGGHTDASGNARANDALSLDRANAVRETLVARGLPAAAMTATGFGQSQPIADNGTPEGRAENRRTSLTWTDPATP